MTESINAAYSARLVTAPYVKICRIVQGTLMELTARAFWIGSPGHGEIRETALSEPAEDEVLVRTLYSGVSRGTETLVFRGGVPENQYTAMRAPFQDGDFPAPVKYGYLNVGLVEEGPAALLGRTVFCLYPHQTRYVVPASAVTVVPDSVPASRAVLAGTVETAVNALWDAAPLIGDRIAVVGGGMVGCSVAALLARFPGYGSSSSTPIRHAVTSRGHSVSTSRFPRTRPAISTSSCTPAPPRPGSRGRWNSSPLKAP